ncbi:MAG: aminotransferase class I/II-fold pyridoxal phosphate-dependent enzyme [Armatimonadetes bacterium]|nr:aminotransferase class I/II-fold pyridoxal phosphate-dependent enzyme [Armatimonadota bacterium]
MERAYRLRTIPPYPFRETAALKAQKIAQGEKLIDFGIGDPDQPTPDFVIEAMAKAIRDRRTHQYDETGHGYSEFLEAIARHMQRRFGVEVDPPKQIQSTIGCKEALVHIEWAYIDPGDIVLVPDPAYSVYKVQATFCGGAAYPMPLRETNGFLPDLGAIPPSIAKRAKLLWLNYPNNPTGAVADVGFLEQAVAFAREYDLFVCQDASYCEVYYGDEKPPSILQVPGAEEVAIEFHSLSKTFNMTGWRVGWAVGAEEPIDGLSKVKANVDSGTFGAVQLAAAVALDHYEEWAPTLREVYRQRRDALVEGLQGLGWPVTAPPGAFYLWVRVPQGETSASFAKTLLEDCGVLAVPGAVYGDHGEGYVRMSLTIMADDPLAAIAEAVARMGELQVTY